MDLSVNITCHKEGYYLYKSLRSLNELVNEAIKNHYHIEVNICLDSADVLTTDIVSRFKFNNFIPHIYKVTYASLSYSRNFLIKNSSGKYIAFLDGDDLYSKNWLIDALKLTNENYRGVFTFNYIHSFEGKEEILELISSNNPQFNICNLLVYNYFPSSAIFHRDIFQKYNYIHTQKSIYGPEDWILNIQLLQDGVEFTVVPNSILFYRRKKNTNTSLAVESNNLSVLPKFSLFEKHNFIKRFKPFNLPKPKEIPVFENTTEKITDREIKLKSLYYYVTQLIKKVIKKNTDIYYFLDSQAVILKKLAYNFKLRWYNRFHPKDKPPKKKKIVKNRQNNNYRINSLINSPIYIQYVLESNLLEPLIKLPYYDVYGNLSFNTNYYSLPTTNTHTKFYYDLCEKFQNSSFTDIFFIPWLIKGGADKVTIECLNTLTINDSTREILVIITENSQNEWLEKIGSNPQIQTILFSEIENIEEIDLYKLFVSLILNWNISRLTIINSKFGFELIEKYGNVLSKETKLILHNYCFELSKNNLLSGYPANELSFTHQYFHKIISDNKAHLELLHMIHNIDKNKLEVLYLPLIIPPLKINTPLTKTYLKKKIFWAGRISDQKLADILIKISKLLSKNNIFIDIWGTPTAEYQDNFNKELNSKNQYINYRGEFNNFQDLPLYEYDLLLYTSKIDGMPNILLEAISNNIFVVTSNSGGIKELINNNLNGILVDDIRDPQKYLEAILLYYENIEYYDSSKVDENRKLFENNFNLSAYINKLNSIY